jgi:hypothetical protein
MDACGVNPISMRGQIETPHRMGRASARAIEHGIRALVGPAIRVSIGGVLIRGITRDAEHAEGWLRKLFASHTSYVRDRISMNC